MGDTRSVGGPNTLESPFSVLVLVTTTVWARNLGKNMKTEQECLSK